MPPNPYQSPEEGDGVSILRHLAYADAPMATFLIRAAK
jgi:hypothetical protein